MFILRQSTAVDVLIGPFVDGTDGVTPEEALSPSVQLSKNGQTAATKNDITTPTHDNAGYYNCEFDATDTGTVGTLVAFVEGTTATHLSVRHEFQIMDTAAFDALFADGAEGPLQATTVGNTLDVTATGAAGIDWNNIENPTTAVNLSATNIDVDQVVASVSGNVADVTNLSNLPSIPANWITTAGITDGAFTAAKFAASSLDGKGDWNINKTGYSVSATGLDAVLEDSTFLLALENQVWDALLTGAAHNDATSAGRRLRSIGDYSVYEGGAVWYDDVNGAAGTTDYENGTVVNPSNAEASVTTLLASLGLTAIHCSPGSTYVLEAAYANKVFVGENWTLNLNGQSCVGCTFIGATVSGAMAGTGTTQRFIGGSIGAASIIKGTKFTGCDLTGTQTLIEAGDIFYDHCYSAVAGSGSVTFDFGAALNSSNLNVRHHSGGWTIANMGAGTGTYNASFEGDGQIIWAASCSATSNASIRGNWKITDNASAAVVETLDDNQSSLDNLNLGIIYGTTSGTPTTTSTNTDLSGYLDSELVGRVIVFTGGTANGQAATIVTYTETNGVVTFAALTTAPAASDTFKIV